MVQWYPGGGCKEKAPSYCLYYLFLLSFYGGQTCKDVKNSTEFILTPCLYMSLVIKPGLSKNKCSFQPPFGGSHLGPLVSFYLCSSFPMPSVLTIPLALVFLDLSSVPGHVLALELDGKFGFPSFNPEQPLGYLPLAFGFSGY